MIFYGEDYPTVNRDEYDDEVDKILLKASADTKFPLHHAIACHLRAAESNGWKKGRKAERQEYIKIITKLSKSWEFVLRYDAAQVCKLILKSLLSRE